jgi:hypothetical protein
MILYIDDPPTCQSTQKVVVPRSVDGIQFACALARSTSSVTPANHCGSVVVQSYKCLLFVITFYSILTKDCERMHPAMKRNENAKKLRLVIRGDCIGITYVCVLFNDTVSSEIIYIIHENIERNQSLYCRGVTSSICVGGLKNHEKFQSVLLISRQKIEPSTFRMRSKVLLLYQSVRRVYALKYMKIIT